MKFSNKVLLEDAAGTITVVALCPLKIGPSRIKCLLVFKGGGSRSLRCSPKAHTFL